MNIYLPSSPVFAAFFALAASSQAALTVMVNPTTKEYYLTGTATGIPLVEDGEGTIFWDNGQALGNGFPNFLGLSAFSDAGDVPSNWTMFFHGNGNVNGVANFPGGGSVTLIADPSVKFSYAAWTPFVIAELESKATAAETVPTTSGSTSFAFNFQSVPEPSAFALVLVGATLGFRRKR